MILEIPRVPSSLNSMLRWHWRYRQKEQQQWDAEVWAAFHQHQPSKRVHHLKKARVRIHRRSRGQLDNDNLFGSVKHVVDALRHTKIIEDDSPDHLKLIVTQSHGPPLTRIEVHAVTI